MATSFTRQGHMGTRGRNEVSLSPVIQLTRYKFGRPNSIKGGRNYNDLLIGLGHLSLILCVLYFCQYG